MAVQLVLPMVEESADLVARLRSFGLPAAVPVALHENRRVMISFDRRGRLRLHRGYSFAPDDVVLALARWAKPRLRRTDRRALVRIFLRFPVHLHVPAPAPRRSVTEPLEPGDGARLERLRATHQLLNVRWFSGLLEPIRISLSGRMRRKLGHYQPQSEGEPAIVISRRHLKRDGWTRTADTVLHEMVHQWQDANGLTVDHGQVFRRKARDVGIGPSVPVRFG